MVHLKERHHTEVFLNIMDSCLPNWKQLKMELNKLPVSHAEWEY
jgi:predicted metal-dependent hydrolase